jgi:hypothetical protein
LSGVPLVVPFAARLSSAEPLCSSAVQASSGPVSSVVEALAPAGSAAQSSRS